MIFRYFLRIQSQRLDRKISPAYFKHKIENGSYHWISELSEWRAFRVMFFPMSVIREIDPKHLRELHRILGKVLADSDPKKNEKETSA